MLRAEEFPISSQMLLAETQGSTDGVGDPWRVAATDGLGDGARPNERIDVVENLRPGILARLGRLIPENSFSMFLPFLSNGSSFEFGSFASTLWLNVILKGLSGWLNKATGVGTPR
jgi:hypothetical protein